VRGDDVTVTEKAEIVVVDGRADDFEALLPKALPLLRGAEGCDAVTIARGVEHPGTFLLLVEWDSLQAHLDFKETTAFGEFVGLVKEFFAAPPGAVHYAPLAV
jgi:quinol monooxygenase YgiN